MPNRNSPRPMPQPVVIWRTATARVEIPPPAPQAAPSQAFRERGEFPVPAAQRPARPGRFPGVPEQAFLAGDQVLPASREDFPAGRRSDRRGVIPVCPEEPEECRGEWLAGCPADRGFPAGCRAHPMAPPVQCREDSPTAERCPAARPLAVTSRGPGRPAAACLVQWPAGCRWVAECLPAGECPGVRAVRE